MFNPQFESYRLLLVAPPTRCIFAERSQHEIHLPQILIPRWTRTAEHLQAALERQWGFKAIILDFLGRGRGREDMVLAELRADVSTHGLAHPHSWVSLSEIHDDEIPNFERSVVERLLKDGATGRGAYSRFGWTEEALDWLTAKAGIDRTDFTGEIRQFNASATFALIRFGRRAAPPLWFKAVGDSSTSEYRITAMLSKFMPRYVPTLVSSREDWNAWWMEDAGRSLDDTRSADLFGQAVSRLAELQKASIRYVPDLISVGCRDHRTPTLRARIPEMMAHIEEAMGQRGANAIPPLSRARIREMGAIVEAACLSLEDLCIPDTLLHGDINFGNILAGPGGCVFTDWAHAAVGHPFVVFENLSEQIAQEAGTAPRTMARLTETYRESWREVLPGAQIEGTFAFVPLVAAALYLFAQLDRLASKYERGPEAHSYVRGLARQIDRAARSFELKELLCS